MSTARSEFLAQVAEQPDRLRDLARFYGTAEGLGLLEAWGEAARARVDVLFAGMGTSELAPLLIVHALASVGLRACVQDAGELYYYGRASLTPGCLPVLISQSGESIETRRLATEYLAGRDYLVVTNDTGSTMARYASLVLPMCAGRETAISTKTYVNTLGLLYLMARSLEGAAALLRARDELCDVADCMACLDLDDDVEQAAQFLLPVEAIQFVARGPSLVAARQAALTYMEGAKVPSAALTAGAFRHGPLELARPGHRAVFYLPRGPTFDVTLGLARECAEKGSRVLIITDADLPGAAEPQVFVLRMPSVGEVLFSLLAATPQALLLHHLADARGYVAGIFDHGEKVTARE
jgi:glucosamine--fructose-6-phosphate aminotransferase (isomerizing)